MRILVGRLVLPFVVGACVAACDVSPLAPTTSGGHATMSGEALPAFVPEAAAVPVTEGAASAAAMFDATGRGTFPSASGLSEEGRQTLTRVHATIPTSLVTRTFGFTLAAGQRVSVPVGPVYAGYGPVEVTLDFSGDFVILACVGAQNRGCRPMGGAPYTAIYDIPSDFPAGPIVASVYFNPNFPQQPGNARGTVSFTFRPLRLLPRNSG